MPVSQALEEEDDVDCRYVLVYGKPPGRNTQLQKDPDQFIANPDGPRGLLLEPDDNIHARHRYTVPDIQHRVVWLKLVDAILLLVSPKRS